MNSLEINPAAMVRVDKVSAPVERALSDSELKQFWKTVEDTDGIGPVMTLLFKSVISKLSREHPRSVPFDGQGSACIIFNGAKVSEGALRALRPGNQDRLTQELQGGGFSGTDVES